MYVSEFKFLRHSLSKYAENANHISQYSDSQKVKFAMKTDISIIINFHRERTLSIDTINGVRRNFELAKQIGLRIQILCILDRSDPETISIVKNTISFGEIHEVDFGDLSKSRNYGTKYAAGKYTSFIDGDDIWGSHWIYSAFNEINHPSCENCIVHPRVNFYFGKEIRPYYWIHPDMRYEKIDLVDILASNRWTSSSFARTEIYRNFPYVQNSISDGFGFEDWLWNIDTILGGIIHITPLETIHFIRIKQHGSLLNVTNTNFALPRVSALYDKYDLIL